MPCSFAVCPSPHQLFCRANELNSNFALCQCDVICWLDEVTFLRFEFVTFRARKC